MVLVLDTGALLAAERRSRAVWTVLDGAQEEGRAVLVPAATLTESIRGGPRDAPINRLLRRPGTTVTVHDEHRARLAGRLLAGAATGDAVDALVVAEAIRHGGAVIATSDPDDIAELARDHPTVAVLRL